MIITQLRSSAARRALQRRTHRWPWRHAGTLLALACAVGGCVDGDLPRSRLGALPFPGMFTLYEPSEVSELGLHHYTTWGTRIFEEGEGARGIMYTRRAGFLDLAHIRNTADWTRYF